MATNAGIAAVVASMIWLVGVGPFLLVHLPIVVLAASIGVWLFYIQHQFEHTVWVGDGTWNLQEAALHGSSHYALPSPLRWFTANIGIHHIHHLCSRIPFYRLPLVLRDHPDLDGIGRLTLLESLRCVRLVLWDEDRQRLVSFNEARRHYAFFLRWSCASAVRRPWLKLFGPLRPAQRPKAPPPSFGSNPSPDRA